MNYYGAAPDVSYYCIDQMHESESKEFLEWYETRENRDFRQKARAGKLLTGRAGAVRGVSDARKTISTDRQYRCFSR